MNKKVITHSHLLTCHSTQDELKRKGEVLASGILISTDRQTQGVGRHQRVWSDSIGSIALSFTTLPHPQITWQSLEVAVLIAQFLENKFHKKIFLKWPNDLMNESGQKIGGILIDAKDGLMIVGIGLNIYYSNQFEYTSLLLLDPPNSTWKQELAHDLVEFILLNQPVPKEDIQKNWEKRCYHLNHEVVIQDGDKETHGLFLGLGNNGQAILEVNGKKIELYTGSLKIKSVTSAS